MHLYIHITNNLKQWCYSFILIVEEMLFSVTNVLKYKYTVLNRENCTICPRNTIWIPDKTMSSRYKTTQDNELLFLDTYLQLCMINQLLLWFFQTFLLRSPPVFSGVRVTRSLVLYVCFVDRCLSICTFSFGYFSLFFFDIRILISLWYFKTLLKTN